MNLPAASEATPLPLDTRIARDHIISLAKLVVDHALQPIVEINTGAVYGYEALMRGHDRLGLNSPIELLDRAAELNRIEELERMLYARAVVKFSSLPKVAGKRLFLNVDGRNFRDGNSLLAALDDALRGRRIPHSSICIELSERHNNASLPEFAEMVKRLNRAGTRIAIDDFGIGHSELKLLCDHGLDYIKVDGHFIRGSSESERKRLFVITIVDLAHVLGIRVIAEGIETEADYIAAREAGCDLAQGYFIARPTCEIEELLESYPHVVAARANRRRQRRTDALLVRSQMIVLPTLLEDTHPEAAFEHFYNSPEQTFFPVVDAAGVPRGILHEKKLKRFIYMPFGRDLLRNPSFKQTIYSFITPCPIVDVNTDAERILEIFANARETNGIILTENARYVGVLSATALLKILNEKLLQQAQDQNPLTELPGNLSISDYVTIAALDGDADRYFCYFDFDHFKPFNDRYGFQHGDRAINLFAALLRRHLGWNDAFLGHVGGDDFFAGCQGRDKTDIHATIARLVEDFQHAIVGLYEPADQQSGYILGVDRDGRQRRFPLMRCSAAIVQLPRGLSTNDLNRIDALIAEAKSAAKRSPEPIIWRRFEM